MSKNYKDTIFLLCYTKNKKQNWSTPIWPFHTDINSAQQNWKWQWLIGWKGYHTRPLEKSWRPKLTQDSAVSVLASGDWEVEEEEEQEMSFLWIWKKVRVVVLAGSHGLVVVVDIGFEEKQSHCWCRRAWAAIAIEPPHQLTLRTVNRLSGRWRNRLQLRHTQHKIGTVGDSDKE